MYIIYKGNKELYASAAISKRKGKVTSIEYTYLGKVIDKEKGIYHSKDKGYFRFDVSSGKYSEVDEDIPVQIKERDKKQSVCCDFGDSFFLHAFLRKRKFYPVLDSLGAKNRDTLYALVQFYILSSMASCDAQNWYEGSFAKYLFPNADLTGQRISETLAQIGTRDSEMTYQQSYIRYVQDNISKDTNVLIDSSGLPNKVKIPLTAINVHNGKVSNEIRLIFVVQKSTGLPLFYMPVAGNIVDASTLRRVLLHMEAMSVNIDSCIIDAGYNTKVNLDFFYDENHNNKMGFITRVKANDSNLDTMVKEEMPTLESRDNLIIFDDARPIYIKKRLVYVGIANNQPAYMYLGLDLQRLNEEQRKLLKRVKTDKLSKDELYDAMENEGLFAILSGKDYPIEEILPAYYQRQSAEQIFDFAKNYTKLLPLRIHKEETMRGHLLLSYIATCIVKMIQISLQNGHEILGSKLAILRNLKCTRYTSRLITDVPNAVMNTVFKIFGIKCPESIELSNGKAELECIFADKAKKASSKSTTNAETPKKEPGRPKGSKNKKTLERLKKEALNPTPKRKPGRPQGSKNKPKVPKIQNIVQQ